MASYKVRILPIAQNDMQEIVNYINTLSPKAAIDLCDEIVAEIGSLAEMPMQCAPIRTPELRAKGYRALRVNNYIVFYIVDNDTVQIRRILYAKRHFDSLL